MRFLLLLPIAALAACGAADAQSSRDPAAVSSTAWRSLQDGSRLRTTDNPAMRMTAQVRCWGRAGAWDCLRVSEMKLQDADVATTLERIRAGQLSDARLDGYAAHGDPAGADYRCELFKSGGTSLITHRAAAAKQSAIAGLNPAAAGPAIRSALQRAGTLPSLFDCAAVADRLGRGGIEAVRRADLD